MTSAEPARVRRRSRPPRGVRVLLALAAAGAPLLVRVAAGPEPPPAPPVPASPAAPVAAWVALEAGLDLGEFPSGLPVSRGDGLVRVLRIDPARFALRLLNASAPGEGAAMSAAEWCRRHGLVAAINASMYQEDLRTSVSLMRTAGHVNNPHLTKDRAILAFDPLEPGLPPVRILDRECDDLETLRGRYGSLVQSIRMVSCAGRNVWQPQPRAFSTAAIGIDREGRVLFLHAASPLGTHEFIEALLRLPIDLRAAMYAEGGREAQLFVGAGGRAFEFLGLPEARFGSGEGPPQRARPIPNVVAVARRSR